ncbi:late endosome to vacuole transport-related [Moniliophthora roreri]|nr:late endosome to vacuole transport-related [Moniliophthora roreri]
MSNSSPRSNGQNQPEFSPSHSFDLSTHEDDDEHAESGDYSSRMKELFADEEEQSDTHQNGYADSDSDESDEFLYTGADADVSIGYKDRLRDVLGPDNEDDDDAVAHDVEHSLITQGVRLDDDEPLSHEISSNELLQSSHGPGLDSPKLDSLLSPLNDSSGLARPFLHPTVSRLRSYTPQGSRVPSSSSAVTQSNMLPGTSPSPSHFSSISRVSSLSNLRTNENSDVAEGKRRQVEQDVFHWTELRNISHHIYSSYSSKASSMLGAASGSPTVLAANGLICIGTDDGKICVYDFKQTLKCICVNTTTEKPVGAVTALALSHDHTYIASGHSTGHIQLFDLKNPQSPARLVPPTTLNIVASGRKEGHIEGSRIVNIGFVAARHTALVSADEHGLSFYHSLGKVLFVEAPDILRILGKYPLDGSVESNAPHDKQMLTPTPSRSKKRSRYTVLGMMPLPLGTTSHPTDSYNIIALLTPSKLVVVGLKPSPKTWFKCPRKVDGDMESSSKSKWRGTLCWFPSVLPTESKEEGMSKIANGQSAATPSSPMLAYSWGHLLKVLRVFESKLKQTVKNSRTGKASLIEIGSIAYEDIGKHFFEEEVLAMQWLNINQTVVLTASTLQVFDVSLLKVVESVKFDGLSLVSPSLKLTVSGASSYSHSVGDVAHSLKTYKGKIFTLGRQHVQVGTLLTWADKILALVEEGDFLNAIELTRSYYLGETKGNTNGLPSNMEQRRKVIGQKMRDLMVASTRYAFSEDRMTDETHITPDGRGVDRTTLFENLVSTCCRACIALDNYDFLFEDLFQNYDDCGITRIYLTQLECFILDNEIRYIPPRITQRLVAMHDEENCPEHVERIIWHIEPECLDINQAITLCQTHHLYDALIYVYTRALRDYVAPVVELLELIRRVYQHRRRRMEFTRNSSSQQEDAELEPLILNAYKVYPYLANVLLGLTYPSEDPLPEEEALQAKKDVYSFLFFGRSSIWPPGEGGKLVLTADEEGGVEPTFPYVRQLLRFDAESFLHSLDLAFEDSYLNDESQDVSRLVIVRVLLEILSSGQISSVTATFINIFIARNVPKYPQFLHIAPSALHTILVGLAEDPDPTTREDRQLAAEFLLSVYNPHESERILQLFKEAGFYRILRTWYCHDEKWIPLLSTYLEDPDLSPFDIFYNIDDVFNSSGSSSELIAFMSKMTPQLLTKSATNTASLLDKHAPELHDSAIESLGEDAEEERLSYLRQLLGPPEDHEEYEQPIHTTHPSHNVSKMLCNMYITLQCKFSSKDVIRALKYLPQELPDWDKVVATCESSEVFDAAMWTLNFRGRPMDAVAKAEAFDKLLTLRLVDTFSETNIENLMASINAVVEQLETVGRTGISICLESSQSSANPDVPLEDIWFRLLSSQIHCVQSVSSCCSPNVLSGQQHAPEDDPLLQSQYDCLNSLRSLIQETFSALVSVSSTRAVSFPRLFSRLVNSATQSHTSTPTHYNEFRSILTSMLESYRSDGDMLIITKHLIDRDVFDTMADVAKQQARGWSPSTRICSACRKPVFIEGLKTSPRQETERIQFIVSRTGSIYHSTCSFPGT